MKFQTLIVLLSSLVCVSAQAVTPKSVATDQRIKEIWYRASQVVNVQGTDLMETMIVFSKQEQILDITVGDSLAWQVTVSKNVPHVLYLKPSMLGVRTNMFVLTNLHQYLFELDSTKAADKSPDYRITFRYPKNAKLIESQQSALGAAPGGGWYWGYDFSGARELAPVQMFDDSDHRTYLKFTHKQTMPAIYAVSPAGKEVLSNHFVKGEYLVLDHISDQWYLRQGKRKTTLYRRKSWTVSK